MTGARLLSLAGRDDTPRKNIILKNMMSTKKGKKLTASGGSDIPEAGAVPGMVPAWSASSSDVGLPSVLPAGADGQGATAAHEKEAPQGGTLLRSASSLSLRSNKSSCSMDVDRENRKRSQTTIEKSSAREEEESEEEKSIFRKVIKRGAKRLVSDEEGNMSAQDSLLLSAQESLEMSSKEQAHYVLLSDEEADCLVVAGPSKKERKGEEVGSGFVEDEGISGGTIKRKRGRPRKIHRKKIGVDELGVHEVADSEDSEGYNVLSAPEMAATAIEYLEEADRIRIKCKNIKGDLSGVMKRRLHNTKEIIKGLARTITKVPQRKEGGEVEDETCFLRMENKELKTRLKEKERTCQQKEKEIQLLRNEMKEINEQMRQMREEIMELKRSSRSSSNGNGKSSPKNKSERRMNRTLKAMENGEDTSIAEDSETMEVENLPTFEGIPTLEWSGTEENPVFKKPHPVNPGPHPGHPGPHPGHPGGPGSGSGRGRNQHLKQKEDTLTKKAVEESLKDYKEIRDKVRRYGTIAPVEQTRIGSGKGEEYPELPKPQRPPRTIQPRKIRTDIKVLENVQIKGPRIEAEQTRKMEESTTDQEWITKKSKKEKKEDRKKTLEGRKQEQDRKRSQPKGKPKMTQRLPRSSAVTIRISDENKEKFTYADILRTTRDKISLEKLGIEKTRIRKTAGGNILIAILG